MVDSESEQRDLPPAPPTPPAEPPRAPTSIAPRRRSPIDPRSWASGSRAVALAVLLGFALVVWVRLTFGRAWAEPFLAENKLAMEARVAFMLQIAAGGAVGGLFAAAWLWRRRRVTGAARQLERWSWFFSPLILLPAIPVFQQSGVWFEAHRQLLPIVLFTGLLVEFFVFQSLKNLPSGAQRFFEDAFEPLTSRLGAFVKRHGYLTIIVMAAVAYGLFMSFYTIRWHHRLGTAIFDLGINTNLFAGGLHGKFNHSTVVFPEDPPKYWANHVKIGLYLFLPIYALIPRPETLLVIQSVSLGLGAIPLFLFARRYIVEWGAALLALAYLSYYPMHGANFFEMKEPPTAAAFVLTMIWAMDSGRFKTGWVFFFLSMIMREDMPIPLTVIGVFLLLSGKRPKTGLVMTIIAASWFVFLRFKVMTDAGSWWFPSMYKGLYAEPDRGFRSVLKTLFSNPTFVLKNIFVEKKFWYLMHMMTPLVFLPARRWYLWAAFVPGAILTLLITDYDPPIMYSFQYVMHWAPYLFVTAALAIAAIVREAPAFGAQRGAAAIAAFTVASAVLSYNYGAFPRRDRALQSGYHKVSFSWTEENETTYQDVRALVRDIPPNASVAASEKVGAHLSNRELFFSLRRDTHGVEYVVTRKSELKLDRTSESIARALKSGDYGVWKRYGEFVVLKRGADTSQNTALLKEWRLMGKGPRTSLARPPVERTPEDAKETEDTKETEKRTPEGAQGPEPRAPEEAQGPEDAPSGEN